MLFVLRKRFVGWDLNDRVVAVLRDDAGVLVV